MEAAKAQVPECKPQVRGLYRLSCFDVSWERANRRLQQKFHVDHIQPPTEFESDLFEVGDFLETEFRVQGDAAFLFAVDTR